MLVTHLRIDGQIFILPIETDVSALKERILATARAGLGFVDFTARGHGDVSVLMTPSVPVRFEVVDVPGDEGEGWDEGSLSFEFDLNTFVV
jgi:hypothetical protein